MEKIKCAHCEFEVILREGQRYCKYCGKPLMNKCTKPHCGKALDDDAAFCPYCGHESKFKIKGIVNSSFIDFSSSTECNVATNDDLQDFNKTCIGPNHFMKAKDDEASESKEKQRQAEVFPVFV